MTKSYYLKNIFWGFFFFVGVLVPWYQHPDNNILQLCLIMAFFSLFLYPYSKLAIEQTALRFTNKDFWHTGLFLSETPGKNGIYVLYYGLCFLLAFPVGIGFLIYMSIFKKAT